MVMILLNRLWTNIINFEKENRNNEFVYKIVIQFALDISLLIAKETSMPRNATLELLLQAYVLLPVGAILGVWATLSFDAAFGVRATLLSDAAPRVRPMLPNGATAVACVACDPKARNENRWSRCMTPVTSPKVASTFAQYCQAITKKKV